MSILDLPFCDFEDMLSDVKCVLSQSHNGEHALVTGEVWARISAPETT